MKFLNASGGTIGSPAGAVYWNIGYTVSATNLILATGPIIMMNSPAFDGPPALASNNSSQTYGYAQILPSTNTLAVPSSGVTNKTIIPYTISVTAGTGMAVVDQAGHQFFTPVINSTFPLQSKQRLTGTGITATGVQQ